MSKRRNHNQGTTKTYKGLPSFTDADLEEEEIDEDVEDIDDDDYDDFEDDEEPEDEIPVDENAPDNSKLLSFDEEDDDEGAYEEKMRIPEWNSYVIIRGLTKSEFDEIRRMTRVRPAAGRSGGKTSRTPRRSGVNRSMMDREVFITGVVSPVIDEPKYNRLVERPGSAGAILKVVKRILEKSGFGDDDEGAAEEAREKRFPSKR